MSRPDFSRIWGSDNAPFTPIEASDYAAGWVFRTGAPPRRVNFDYFQNLSDQRTAWLGEQMLLAVGHEWQDDVTYNEYAVVRSPVNGQLYRSLVGSNLGNEPSVSGAQWAPGLGNEVPSSLLTSGIAGSFSNLKASATGLSALVTVTADSLCLKSSANEQVVLNSVSVTPSLDAIGANGLDAGSSVASTWYYVWVIWNGATTAGLLSLSATSPAMPVGYTHKALVGAVFSDATANKYPLSFKQDGNLVRYKVATGSNVPNFPIAASGVAGNVLTPTYVSVSLTAFVPPNARAAIITYNVLSADANVTAMISANNNTDIINSPTNPPDYNFTNTTTGGSSSYPIRIHLETLALFWANNNGNGRLRVLGWEF
jgi:hypothetical protein